MREMELHHPAKTQATLRQDLDYTEHMTCVYVLVCACACVRACGRDYGRGWVAIEV